MIQYQKFSSNLIDFKKNIPYQDTSLSSDSYFRLFDVPSKLFLGKNSFRIRVNKDYIVPNSLVYIDLIDSSGKPIYHEVSSYLGEDNSRLVIINVYENTPPGEATLYIAGRINYNVKSKMALPYSNDAASFDFKDIPNLLWEKKLLVIPTAQNLEEIIYFAPPKIEYKERSEVFNKLPNLNTRYETISGSVTEMVSLKSVINPYQYSNSSRFNTTKEVDRFTIDIDPDNTGEFLTSQQTQLPKYSELSTLFSTGFDFTPNMLGGKVIIRNVANYLQVPSSSLTETISDFSCSIVEIIDRNTAKVDAGFNATANGVSYNSILNATNFTCSYYSKDATIQSQYSESFLELNFSQLEPVAGIVDTIKLSYKSFGSFGDFAPIGTFTIKEQNILVDSSSIIPSKLEIIEKPIGQLDDWTEFSTYWDINENPNFDINCSFSSSMTFERGVSLIFTASAAITPASEYLVYTNVKESFRPKVNENTEYKLELSSRVTSTAISSNITDLEVSQIDVYISGSGVVADIVHQPNILAPLKNNTFGNYIGSISNNAGNTQLNSKLYFKALSDAYITPILVVRSGQYWELKDIKLIPRNESGYSPNQAKLQVPLNTFKTNTELILLAEYLNSSGRKSEYETKLIGVNFTGSSIHQILRESNIISGSGQVQDILENQVHYITFREQPGDPTPMPGSVQIFNSGSPMYYQDATGSKFQMGGIASGSGVDWLVITNKPAGLLSGSNGFLSSSAQIASEISGAFTTVSSSLASEKLNKVGSNVFSSSTQLPSGIISSSAQLPSGLISSSVGFLSSSAQIASDISGAFTSISSSLATNKLNKIGDNVYSSSNQLPAGIISSSAGFLSSSAQISTDISGAFTLVSSSLASEKLNKVGSNVYSSSNQLPSGIISSSGQISTDISGAFNSVSSSLASEKLNKVGSGVYSSSAQLPSNLLSSSAQISTDISGAFTTISSSLASEKLNKVGSNVYSSSTQLPSGIISSSTQINSNLQNPGVQYITYNNQSSDPTPISNALQIFSSASLLYYQDGTGSNFQIGGPASGSGADWSVITNKPANLLSSSAQIASAISGAFTDSYTSLSTTKLDISSAGQHIVDYLYISGTTRFFSFLDYGGVPPPETGRLQLYQNAGILYYQDDASNVYALNSVGGTPDWSVITGIPSGLMSSSAQLPSGLISSSTQLPSGLLSSSAQISTDISGAFTSISSSLASEKLNKIGSNVYSSSNQLPSGIISSSAQLSTDISGAFTIISSSLASEKLNTVGSNVYSSSTQLPSGLISSSTQLPNGLISSSAQISTDISGAFTTISASLASEKLNKVGSNVYSSSTQLPSGLISSSNQLPANIISSSTQVNSHLQNPGVQYITYNNQSADPTPIADTLQIFSSGSLLYYQDGTGSNFQIGGPATGSGTDWSVITNKPSGLISSSAQLPSGLLSSSAQIATDISGAFTTISSSLASDKLNKIGSNVYSSSNQLPSNIISSSAQISSEISGAFTLVSSSLASEKLNKIGSNVYSSSTQLPSGIVSSSAQISTEISGAFTSVSSSLASEKLNKIGSNVYSSSNQLPSGLLSSSAQISTDISGAFTTISSSLASEKLDKIGSGIYSSSAQLPSGIISGSSQIASEISGAFTSISSSLASEKLNKVGSGVYSSSAQLPSGIISGSSQLPSGLFSSSAQLPSGIISSSAQISTEISGAFTSVSSSLASEKLNKVGSGVYSSSTQLPSGLISSSTQLPSGIISSSTQLPSGLISSSAQLPSGIISSSTQLPSGIISGAAQLLPRVSSSATNATPIPNVDTTDIYTLTALASAATFGAPTGTANNGEKLIIRIKDNGGAQTIGWNAAYSAAGIPLPVSTTASKTMHCGFMYNADNALNKWELIAFLTA